LPVDEINPGGRVKVPFKKLFAVATFVGAASGSAGAVTSQPPVAPVAPLALLSGAPACGNMTFKGGGPPPCTTPEKTALVAVKASLTGLAIAR
jgi:hypothetical protein